MKIQTPGVTSLSQFMDAMIAVQMGPEYVTIERWKYLAYLYFCNGMSFAPNGTGMIITGVGPWKHGLDANESIHMQEICCIIAGASWYDNSFEMIYAGRMRKYIYDVTGEGNVLENEKPQNN